MNPTARFTNKLGFNVEMSICENSVVGYLNIDNYTMKIFNKFINADTTTIQYQTFCKEYPFPDKISLSSLRGLLAATEVGNLTLIEYIVSKLGRVILNTGDSYGITPLHFLCQKISINTCTHPEKAYAGAKKLLELGANPNVYSSDYSTPLSKSAVVKKGIPIASLIIEHGGLRIAEYKPRAYCYKFGMIDRSREVAENIINARELIHLKRRYVEIKIAKYDTLSHLACFPPELMEYISTLFLTVCLRSLNLMITME